jgi:hypothetical protein
VLPLDHFQRHAQVAKNRHGEIVIQASGFRLQASGFSFAASPGCSKCSRFVSGHRFSDAESAAESARLQPLRT